MGCHMSKKAIETTSYITELTSYEAACKADPNLLSFDSTLHVRTNHVISKLSSGVEVRSLSFDSLKEITECLLEMNQQVAGVFLECKEDIWKNQELFKLVEEYFDNSLQTLDFCAALEKCLKRVKDRQMIIKNAIEKFENDKGRGSETRYLKTLKELKNFRDTCDPFTEEFFQIFRSVYNHQISILEKLEHKKNMLDKKLRQIHIWRKVSGIIFVATFTTVLVCSMVAAAVAVPPVAAALAAATSVPVGSMGKWVDSLWRNYKNVLKSQKGIINSVHVVTRIAIKDLENTKSLIDRIEIGMESLVKKAEFSMNNDALKVGIEQIKKELDIFNQNVEDLSSVTDRCIREVRRAKTVVLQKIIKHTDH